MNTLETSTPDSLGAAHGSATVLDEYVRIDKAIRDCEHALLVAERLKARGHTLPENEVDAVRLKLSEAMIERDFMDEWMRRAKSPNKKAETSATCDVQQPESYGTKRKRQRRLSPAPC